MTTLAALFAALPLMLGWGEGAELRRPLGLAIFGGLVLSQMLTLFTTPVIYLAFDRVGRRFSRRRARRTTPRPRTSAHEPVEAFRPAPHRHRPADASASRWRASWPSSCCRCRRCRRSTSRPSRCQRQPAGRQPEHHGVERRHAAGAPARRDRRRQRDHVEQLQRLGPRHAAVRPEPQHRLAPRARCRPPSTRARADLPATLRSNPTYRKAQPDRGAGDHPGADLEDAHAGPDLRRGVEHREPAAVAGRRRGRGRDRRRLAAGGARSNSSPIRSTAWASAPRTCAPPSRPTTPTGPRARSRATTAGCRSTRPRPGRCAAADYRDLVIAWRNNAAVRLRDVAERDRQRREHRARWACSTASRRVIVLVTQQPGANIIETVDGVRDLLPELRAQLPPDIDLQVASDRTNSIRASLREVELTLMISIVLVVLVVGAVPAQRARHHHAGGGDRRCRCSAPSASMYLLGYSLNNLSLMALTVATGFVVDDAIVVLENTHPPHRERHEPRRGGAARRARSASRCCRSACRWWRCSSRCCSWAGRSGGCSANSPSRCRPRC